MKPAQSIIIRFIAGFVFVFSLSSCDDQNLVNKNEELSGRVDELKQAVRLLKADLKKKEVVQTSDIDVADKTLQESQQEVQRLRSEKDDLDKKHDKLNRQLDKQFEAYQRELSNNMKLSSSMERLTRGIERLEGNLKKGKSGQQPEVEAAGKPSEKNPKKERGPTGNKD